MRRAIGTATIVVGAVALTLGASPALAATLPATDAVYVLPCDFDEYDGILYSVDTTTGQATRVGEWVNPDDDLYSCAGPAAYNPADGFGYWISWGDDAGYLIRVDLTTGVNTLVGPFTIDDEPYYTPIGLAIDDEGNAWVSSWGLGVDTLFSVDLATGALTAVGPTGVTPDSDNYGLAWDPVTDTVYAYNVFGNDMYTVDTVTGAFTLFDDNVLTNPEPIAMHFDSAGQVWGINGDIVSAPLNDLAGFEVLEVSNPRLDAEGEIYSESIIIGPAPAPAPVPVLPATGVDRPGTLVVAGVGLILMVAGIGVVRRRSAAA